MKTVATGDTAYALPSIEPVAIIRPQGVRIKNYYTAYQGNIYGIAVPEESPIKAFPDLRGKRIGVIGMGSGGVIVARAIATMNGMDPDRDVSTAEVAPPASDWRALFTSAAEAGWRRRNTSSCSAMLASSELDSPSVVVSDAGVRDGCAMAFLILRLRRTPRRDVRRGLTERSVYASVQRPGKVSAAPFTSYPRARPPGDRGSSEAEFVGRATAPATDPTHQPAPSCRG